MKYPLISVIIVSYNGRKWLTACLSSLNRQTYPRFETILVDNHSSDGSVRYVKANFPKVKVITNSSNLGFATGNNIGAKHSKGEYLVLLNNDTQVPKNYLSKFYEAFTTIPNLAIAQSKIILMDDHKLLDSCGSFWTVSTYQYYLGNRKSPHFSIYQTPQPVFSVKGASVMIKKEVINRIDLFDDDFWCYYEETDFCHRAWIAGYECWYWPKTYIYHAMGGTSLTFPNSHIQFHNLKNKLLSLLKNFEVITVLYELPTFLFINLMLAVIWLCQGKFNHFITFPKAVFWNLTHFRSTFKKRLLIQQTRTKSDLSIFSVIKKEPHLSYYYYLFINRLDLYAD